MADKKISQLTNASTPLAGTEVLPIVQSSATVKVATNDLTVKNVRSNATTGILQIAGPAAAATRTMTVPDANFTAARTDAGNSFTSNQTLADGNLVVGTSGKGIDFSANTGAAGETGALLNWYEEGTWTGTLKGSVSDPTTPVTATGYYVRIGRLVSFQIYFDNVNTTGASGNASVSGLPFTNTAQSSAVANVLAYDGLTWSGQLQGSIGAATTTISFLGVISASAWQNATHNAGTSRYFVLTGLYQV